MEERSLVIFGGQKHKKNSFTRQSITNIEITKLETCYIVAQEVHRGFPYPAALRVLATRVYAPTNILELKEDGARGNESR